jgi:hypothetical protein
MLKTALDDNAMGRIQNFGWFSSFRCGETSVKFVSLQLIPPLVAYTKTWRQSQNNKQRPFKYHFRDHWQVKPLIWNMPENSNGGLEHVAALREVCALVAH